MGHLASSAFPFALRSLQELGPIPLRDASAQSSVDCSLSNTATSTCCNPLSPHGLNVLLATKITGFQQFHPVPQTFGGLKPWPFGAQRMASMPSISNQNTPVEVTLLATLRHLIQSVLQSLGFHIGRWGMT